MGHVCWLSDSKILIHHYLFVCWCNPLRSIAFAKCRHRTVTSQHCSSTYVIPDSSDIQTPSPHVWKHCVNTPGSQPVKMKIPMQEKLQVLPIIVKGAVHLACSRVEEIVRLLTWWALGFVTFLSTTPIERVSYHFHASSFPNYSTLPLVGQGIKKSHNSWETYHDQWSMEASLFFSRKP